MFNKVIFILSISALLSCSSEHDSEIISPLENNDTLKVEQVDSIITAVNIIDTVTLDSSYTIDVEEEELDNALEAIVEGKDAKGIAEGYSFCDCVKLIDALETKMFEDDDADIDALMTEQKNLLEGDCAILKAGQGITTAEDKAAYEKKKNDCLN